MDESADDTRTPPIGLPAQTDVGSGATPNAPAPAKPDPSPPSAVAHTRVSGIWAAVIVALIVLVFLLIFIIQNLSDATVYFLGGAATLPIGVALLFAAVAGAVLVALAGVARILQLRRRAKRLQAPGR